MLKPLLILGVAQGIGKHFDARNISPGALAEAIAQNRSLLAEAWQSRSGELHQLGAEDRADILGWGDAEYIRVLQTLAATHKEHAKLLHAAYWTYVVPQFEAAKALLRSQSAAVSQG